MTPQAPVEAIVLAAGVGSRLSERTGGTPKCLIEVGGVAILERQIRALRQVGVRRLVVVTGYHEQRVRSAVAAFAHGMDAHFVHNSLYADTNVLYSWRLGSDRLSGDHYYLHADTVFEPDLLLRLHPDSGRPVTLTVDTHECGKEEMKVRTEAGHIVEISKTMRPADAMGEFTGVMRVSGEALAALRTHADVLLEEEGGGTLFVEAALQRFLETEPASVDWVDVTDLRWREIDFPEDLDAAEHMFSGPH